MVVELPPHSSAGCRLEKKHMKLNLACLRNAAIAAAAILMAACGGEEAPGPSDTTTAPTTSAALATLEVTAASATLSAKADQTTTVTITAIDADRRALADVPVTLSASSGVLSGQSDTTDSSGKMTASLSLGADRGNRAIQITATSGSIVGSVAVQVSGTTVALTASPPTAQTADDAGWGLGLGHRCSQSSARWGGGRVSLPREGRFRRLLRRPTRRASPK